MLLHARGQDGDGISVIFGDDVESIPSYAFYPHLYSVYASKISSITTGKKVTQIGNYAFYSCLDLASLTLSDSVTSIGDFAFYSCSDLTSLTIPDGVTSIGDSAFRYCSSLFNISIGENVTRIGESAFSNCTSLTQINWNAKSVSDYLSSFACAGQEGGTASVLSLETRCKPYRIMPLALMF